MTFDTVDQDRFSWVEDTTVGVFKVGVVRVVKLEVVAFDEAEYDEDE